MIPFGGFQVQKPCHFVAMAFVVLNTRLNLRFRLAQNNKSQHIVLAFVPAEREGLSSLRSDIGGLHFKKQMPGLRLSSFFIAVALENKFSTLHQRKMPHKGAFVFCAEREDNELTHLTHCISRFYFLVFSLETPLETKRPKGGLDCPC
jgi:hypothetical protein